MREEKELNRIRLYLTIYIDQLKIRSKLNENEALFFAHINVQSRIHIERSLFHLISNFTIRY
jgi:hypothetical protein